ncbi:tryptophan synthase subunit alpha [Thiospirochaeta perfilievii]|uniref:Tryptophan synthase alpha chain n=1 Tax=Thiospirochaeta perfilievii TaxID=252967 RepID=A0A5C1QD77_9SPIO|nr:tryptophan synthase subunit alpha [Thiospirochaeta perfilievii]QEN06073.1 tryptophan synthase subunit alpha [Thiospirochaeta perfilievii]
MNREIVSHLVAGYPTLEGSFEVAKGLIDGKGYALEIQIPFSDPSADGPTIEVACSQSLKLGFKVDMGFELIKRVKLYSPETPIYLMSYASIVFTNGVENFVKKAKLYGVEGLIIPDLTVGADEGLYELGKKYDVNIIPVLVTSVPKNRVDEILRNSSSDWVYIALRGGITGSYTEITKDNLDFLDYVKGYNKHVMAGFGIQSKEQIDVLDKHVDASVVGSYFVKKTKELFDKKMDLSKGISQVISDLRE